LNRRSGKLELAARLQRNGAEPDRVGQANDGAAVENRLPAEKALHRFKEPHDAARPLIRDRAEIVAAKAELLVLGADAPLLAWLRAGFECLHKLIAGCDRRRVRGVAGHFTSGSERERRRNLAAPA